MRTVTGGLGVVAVLVLAGTAWGADEEKIPLDKVPRAVLDAVKARFEGARLKGAEKETEDKKTYYEVQIEHKGKKIEVILTPGGKIVAIETVIATTDLPTAVLKTVESKYPKGKIRQAEEIQKDGKVFYELVIDTADSKKLEVVFDPKGKVVDEEKK